MNKLLSIGAPKDRTSVMKNLKFDVKPSTETVLQATGSKMVPTNGWIRSNGQIAIKFTESGNSEDIRILSFYPLI